MRTRSMYPSASAPFGAHSVSGTNSHGTAGKTPRLPQDERTRQPYAPVSTGRGTVRGRQAALTPERKRTALMWGIG